MKKFLFLDDVRNPINVAEYILPITLRPLYLSNKWDIVRNYDEFVEYISHNNHPHLISFDHDLADEHYHQSMFTDPTKYNSLSFLEKTGYDCAKWLVEHCIDTGKLLPEYICHSMNPVGRENILMYLNNFQKIQTLNLLITN